MWTHRQRGRRGLVAMLAAIVLTAGCGFLALERKNFPAAGTGDEGQAVFLDDIQEIVNDTAPGSEQRREALRDLGIEDEDLLDALVAAGTL